MKTVEPWSQPNPSPPTIRDAVGDSMVYHPRQSKTAATLATLATLVTLATLATLVTIIWPSHPGNDAPNRIQKIKKFTSNSEQIIESPRFINVGSIWVCLKIGVPPVLIQVINHRNQPTIIVGIYPIVAELIPLWIANLTIVNY